MPTDILLTLQRRLAARKREERRLTLTLLLIAVAGTALTLFKAGDSEVFEAALLAFGTLE